jgi:hypothetical protein
MEQGKLPITALHQLLMQRIQGSAFTEEERATFGLRGRLPCKVGDSRAHHARILTIRV